MSVTIREKESSAPLAQADVGPSLTRYEGNWYFDPATVKSDVLRVTDRTYTCPQKGPAIGSTLSDPTARP
jgi:uncharacterized protein (DUF427 family)